MFRTLGLDLRVKVLVATADGASRRAAGLRFLPPFSPGYDPIELAFFRLEALLRHACWSGSTGTFFGRLSDN